VRGRRSPAATLASKRSSHQPMTVSNPSRGGEGFGAAAHAGDQDGAFAARFAEVVADRAEAQADGVAATDGVLAVGLEIDAALDAPSSRPLRIARARHRVSLLAGRDA
jgi:hypothetical protein